MSLEARHGKQTIENGIHTAIAYEYADGYARNAALGFDAADIGKLARQLNDNSIYVLVDDTPPTWVQIAAPSGVPAHAITHQDGYADEINVTNLSGLLADPQKIAVRKNAGPDIGARPRINLNEGSNISLVITDDNSDNEIDVTVSATNVGEVNTGVNVGSGAGVFRDKTGLNLNFRTINGINNISAALNGDNIDIDGFALLPRNGSLPMIGDLSLGSNSITNVNLVDGVDVSTHASRHQDGGADEINVNNLSGLLSDPQRVTIRKNTGANVGSRPRINFVEGANVTITTIDDPVDEEVDVVIAAGATVFGTNFVSSESLGISSTTGTSYVTKLTLNTGSVTGTHILKWYCLLSKPSGGNPIFCRVRNITDSATVGGEWQKDQLINTDKIQYNGFILINMSGTAKTFELQFRGGGGNTAQIEEARFAFWRIS